MYFWRLVKKVVWQVEDLSFFYFFYFFTKKWKKVKKSIKKYFQLFLMQKVSMRSWLHHNLLWESGSASRPHVRHNRFGFCKLPKPVALMFVHVAPMCTQVDSTIKNAAQHFWYLPPLSWCAHLLLPQVPPGHLHCTYTAFISRNVRGLGYKK